MQNKIIIASILAAVVACFFIFNLGHYLNFDYIKSQQSLFESYKNQNFALSIAIYFIIYVIVTSLSFPGAAILTLLGGALFGLLQGAIIVSFASTTGATLAFLTSRILLRENLQKKFGDKLKTFNKGIEQDGLFYLFTMRLIPAFPFFVINLIAGLTSLKTLHYAIVSQIGMLPGTLVYVNAGTELGKIDSLKGILSLNLIISFVLLGFFPLIAKKSIQLIKNKKQRDHS